MSTEIKYFVFKNFYKISIILLILNSSCATQSQVSAQRGYESTQIFYDQLSPYGQWIDNHDYGYVWFPDVDRDFSPYSTSGYWVMTNYGWTWVSDYSWGWAPFHYGRWDYDNFYGWFWVPDNQWGPSWVTWRTGNGYYGWTPMRPGNRINSNFGNGYDDIDRWNFVRDRDFGRSDIHRYYADRRDYNTIINNSTVINNTYIDRSNNTTYISGPTRNDVQIATGRKVKNISVRDYDRPGQVMKSSQLQIYRPVVHESFDRTQKSAPNRISDVRDVKPASERNSQNNTALPVENNRRDQQTQPTQQSQPQNNRRQNDNLQRRERQQIDNNKRQNDPKQQQQERQPQQQNENDKQQQQQNDRRKQQQHIDSQQQQQQERQPQQQNENSKQQQKPDDNKRQQQQIDNQQRQKSNQVNRQQQRQVPQEIKTSQPAQQQQFKAASPLKTRRAERQTRDATSSERERNN